MTTNPSVAVCRATIKEATYKIHFQIDKKLFYLENPLV